MEVIADADYRHPEKIMKSFERKNLGEYHDLYIESDTLLLPDVFEIFRDKYIEIYELDPAPFFICTRISIAGISNPIQDGPFLGCSRMEGSKSTSSLEYVAFILQR